VLKVMIAEDDLMVADVVGSQSSAFGPELNAGYRTDPGGISRASKF
jgi:hypothetical protein